MFGLAANRKTVVTGVTGRWSREVPCFKCSSRVVTSHIVFRPEAPGFARNTTASQPNRSRNMSSIRTFVLAAVLASGCGRPAPEPIDDPPPAPPPTPVKPPEVKDEPVRPTLSVRHRYFQFGKRPGFVLGRNPAGKNPKTFEDHFKHAAAAGEHFVRIHFTYMPQDEKPGEIAPYMLQSWDKILDSAEEHGLAVMPVLGGWAEWNDGSNNETWHMWDKNPFNASNGGPAKKPNELYDDTECRKLWLKRLETLVQRWAARMAIVAWEIFSEVDLVSGSFEERAVEFVQLAAQRIRAHDPEKRPITASQAGISEWPKLCRSPFVEFLEVHPYADAGAAGQLDVLILTSVRLRLEKYGKPVMIGECGLDSGPPRGKTLDTAPRAEIGVRHAIWASMVSGAMNGRMLWWQDGYDEFEKADICRHYHQIAVPAVTFAKGMDFLLFVPVECKLSDGLRGAVLGNEKSRIGWVRDAHCIPPQWPTATTAGQSVTVYANEGMWRVEFFDTKTGMSTSEKKDLKTDVGRLTIPIPEFRESIAFKLNKVTP